MLEYYYGLHQLHKNRQERQAKYNFEDIATKQLQIAMGEISDPNIKHQAYNPHDYIDDKLLNKLYYTSNAKSSLVGPGNALYGLVGYSAALSGHYLYKQLNKYLNRRINDMEENDEDDEDERKSVDILSLIKEYKQAAINLYHCFVFGLNGLTIGQAVFFYALQMRYKRDEKGGYGYMSSGKGAFGFDFGTLAAVGSGIMAYPIVLKLEKIKRMRARK